MGLLRTLQRAPKGYHLVLNGCQDAAPTLAELFLVTGGSQFSIESCIHPQHLLHNLTHLVMLLDALLLQTTLLKEHFVHKQSEDLGLQLIM